MMIFVLPLPIMLLNVKNAKFYSSGIVANVIEFTSTQCTNWANNVREDGAGT